MLQCRECAYYCAHGENIRCPFFQGHYDQLQLKEIEERAKNKDKLARIYLAVCRADGERGLTKPSKGVSQLKKLARKNPLAKGFLGLHYLNGSQTSKKDAIRGFKLCKEGAYNTCCHQLEAQLSECYERGIGTARDYEEAKKQRKAAALRGNDKLLMQAAEEMEYGSNLDIGYAISLYKRAEQWGLPMGEERLRRCYLNHFDKVVGEYIYEKAVGGSGSHQLEIAHFFLEKPFKYNPQEAIKWYHAAAMRNSKAAYELAEMYLEGTIWGKDTGLAWWYLKQAYDIPEAEQLLNRLESEAKDNLENEAFFQTPSHRALWAALYMSYDPDRAKASLEQGAAQDCVCSLEALGVSYFVGRFGRIDYGQAFSYLSRAWKHASFTSKNTRINGGSPLAGSYLACCYYAGLGTKADKNKATEIIEAVFNTKIRFQPAQNGDYFELKRVNAIGNRYHMERIHNLLKDININYSSRYLKEMVYGINLLGCCLMDQGCNMEAKECLSKAAEVGLPSAHLNLAILGEQNAACSMSQEDIFQHYKKALEGGLGSARYKVGLCYLEGRGTEPNYPEALRLITLVAESGSGEALEKLGDCYFTGVTGAKSIPKAIRYYEEASAAGRNVADKLLQCLRQAPDAQITTPAVCAKLGSDYYNNKNYSEAVKWLTKAAGEQFPEATSMLADCYRYGKGIQQNLAESFRLHKIAAEKKIPQSQYGLGLCYYYGEGTAVDKKQAAQLFLLAAKNSHMEAQKMRAVCCYNGEGVERNYKEAYDWFSLAETKGDALASRNLGLFYEFGNGVQMSLYVAEAKYQEAVQRGYDSAKEDLKRLKKKREEAERRERQALFTSYSTSGDRAPSYSLSNYKANPYEDLDYDSSIRFINRCLKTDLDLCSSEEEKKKVLAEYHYKYPDTPLYETDTSYTPSESLDDHDYLELLNDIM